MRKTLAKALRALARRLDPPAPVTFQIYELTTAGTANQVATQINWRIQGGR